MGLHHVAAVLFTILFALIVVGATAPRLLVIVGAWRTALLLTGYYGVGTLTLSAFWKVVSSSPGHPSDVGGPCMETGRSYAGHEMRMCYKCKCFKPDRCHHCSDCGLCTLKMDHHCPWVNNCVGFKNYKFFFLLLLYGLLAEVYAMAVLIYVVVWRQDAGYDGWDYVAMVCVGLVGLFAIGTVALTGFHITLVVRNQTTLEQLRALPTSTYSLGVFRNLQQVLGRNPLVWGVPFFWGVDTQVFDGVNWDDPELRPKVELHPVELDVPASGEGAGDAASASLGERANAEAGPPEPEHPATLHDPYGDGRRRRPPLAHDWQDAQGNSGVGGGSAAQWAPRSPRDTVDVRLELDVPRPGAAGATLARVIERAL